MRAHIGGKDTCKWEKRKRKSENAVGMGQSKGATQIILMTINMG